jgi:hypothetical protein
MAITQGAGAHFATLTINGSDFPIEHGSVSQEAKRKSASFSVSIPMSYPGAREMLASIGENTASISVTTRGMSGTLITGEADNAMFDYIGRTIEVTGRDKSAKLHELKTSEKWVNKKTTDVVQDLIGRVGLSGNISASSVMAGKMLQQDYVRLTDNVSYAYIIHRLSQLDGARWWVDGNGNFNYAPIGNPQGIYSIMINQDADPISADCLVLRIHRNIQASKNIAVTVQSWHPKKKQVFAYTSNVEGSGGQKTYNYHIPNLLQDHVTKHAQSRAGERARHEHTVEATVVGDPTVAAGMGLQLNGTDFDQTFDIDSVHHEFGMSGHRTSITARAAKQGRSAS